MGYVPPKGPSGVPPLARPSGVISTEKPLTEATYRELRQQIMDGTISVNQARQFAGLGITYSPFTGEVIECWGGVGKLARCVYCKRVAPAEAATCQGCGAPL